MARQRRPSETPEIAAGYDELLAAQGGTCAIAGCNRTPKTRRFPHDHNHKTGQWRGLVCHWHNRIMPKTSGEAYALARYLEAYEPEAAALSTDSTELLTDWYYVDGRVRQSFDRPSGQKWSLADAHAVRRLLDVLRATVVPSRPMPAKAAHEREAAQARGEKVSR